MIWLTWIWEGIVAGSTKVLQLWWLIFLFIAIQILKDSGWLGKASRLMAPLLKPLRLPDEAGLPMVAGLAVGVTYGAGVIIQSAEEGRMTRDQLTVMCVFLGICHAVIEETILFTAAGANGLMLLAIRFVSGAVAALALARVTMSRRVAEPALTEKGA